MLGFILLAHYHYQRSSSMKIATLVYVLIVVLRLLYFVIMIGFYFFLMMDFLDHTVVPVPNRGEWPYPLITLGSILGVILVGCLSLMVTVFLIKDNHSFIES